VIKACLDSPLAKGRQRSSPIVIDAPDSSPAPYFANVIAPTPGACFRYVADKGRHGYPTCCPEPVHWCGVIVDTVGKRIDGAARNGHVADLVRRNP
jgi:hypothetical protein